MSQFSNRASSATGTSQISPGYSSRSSGKVSQSQGPDGSSRLNQAVQLPDGQLFTSSIKRKRIHIDTFTKLFVETNKKFTFLQFGNFEF